MSDFVKVAEVHELPPGSSRTVSVDGRTIALFNIQGRLRATSDACPHEGASLGTGGDLDGSVVTCGYHYWSFDVDTGESSDGMEERLACYEVRVEGTYILVSRIPRTEGFRH